MSRARRRSSVIVAAVVALDVLALAGPGRAHDWLRVELDKASVLRLENNASTVIVGNPNIADVQVESPRLVLVFGIQPGETTLQILDAEGKSILSTPVVVVPVENRTVTMHRAIQEITLSCDPRCSVVRTPGAELAAAAQVGGATTIATAQAPGAAAASGAGGQQLLAPPTGEE